MSTLLRSALVAGLFCAAPFAASAQRALSATDLEPFVDGIVRSELAQSDVAGAVVAVVAGGAPLLVQGYGFADAAKTTPVDGERTLFRPASISKLFTAIAVLQLVEQGKLDLDADANAYLDFQIPPTAGKPITLRQLLTHRAGFEERLRDLGKAAPPPIPLGELLRGAIPRRSLEPERWPAYSNYGLALAGYIVERTAGVPFADYVEQHVLEPLGMEHASFAQPLPERIAPFMSRGFLKASGEAGPFEVVNDVPAGGLSASGGAMARFMLALLAGGELEGRRVLSPESFARLLEPQVSVAGNALGLVIYESRLYGVRLLGHGGDLSHFHSDLAISPAHGFGVFVSQNSAGNGGPLLRSVLVPALVQRYLAVPIPEEPAVIEAGHAEQVSGVYMVSRRSDASVMRILGLIGQIDVRAMRGGRLETRGIANEAGNPKRWREVAPFRFRSLDGRDEIEFERDAGGRAVRLLPPFPGLTFERARWVDTQAFALGVAAPAGVIALCALFAPLAGAVARRALGAPPAPARPIAARSLSPLTAALWLAHFGGIAVFAGKAAAEVWRFSRGEDGVLLAAVGIGWIAALGSLATAALAAWGVRDSRRPLARRLASALPALAFLALAWLSWNWGLLSDPTRY